jgi:hypothetical protein
MTTSQLRIADRVKWDRKRGLMLCSADVLCALRLGASLDVLDLLCVDELAFPELMLVLMIGNDVRRC